MSRWFSNNWRIILQYALGLLVAAVVFWGLYRFIVDGDWLGLSAVATLLLAITAFWNISETRYLRKKDREKEHKARSAEESSISLERVTVLIVMLQQS